MMTLQTALLAAFGLFCFGTGFFFGFLAGINKVCGMFKNKKR